MPHDLPVLGGSIATAQSVVTQRSFPLRSTSSVRGLCSRASVKGLFERPRRPLQSLAHGRVGGSQNLAFIFSCVQPFTRICYRSNR